ncbi:FAD-dependent oxidoreductase [Nocardia sp. BMG51109]|uniref:hydroxysqualene dehydroxylase n=1 Tax=Nocardia sp. BMG51109 TaxID=1056816 RepID=UPI0004634F5A|nr:FAD-dependent oxidoreductase [Nocardia sp. BMG51109]
MRSTHSTTRRGFLGLAATAAAGVAVSTGPARAAAPGRRVAILGGGVAGLSAAHELGRRGFAVTVYERTPDLGGKARSNTVPGSGTGGRPELPGEHGYRGFLGFYHNLDELMKTIPHGPGRSVFDNLVPTGTGRFFRVGGRPEITATNVPRPWNPGPAPEEFLANALASIDLLRYMPAAEADFFLRKLLVFMTSGPERREGQWENLTWSRFLCADTKSAEYDALLVRGLTRNLASIRSDEANARSVGIIGEAFILSLLGFGNTPGSVAVRVLEGATNELWIHPWVDHLRDLGVGFETGWAATALTVADGQITDVVLRDAGGTARRVDADWYVLAVPAERAAPLLTGPVLDADPALAGVHGLRTDWMSGIQFYLRKPLPLTAGGTSYVDSPWALTSISQAQFWRRPMADYGDGTVRDILSAAIADWTTPGIVHGKPARDCTRTEIAEEVWAQITAHINDNGPDLLTRPDLHSWHLDPAITGTGTPDAANDTPLFIQHPGSWQHRPAATTALPNLFLAADYVRTGLNVATMESANIAARAATNALLARAGSTEPPCRITPLQRPPLFAALESSDDDRYRRGLPHILDTEQPAVP